MEEATGSDGHRRPSPADGISGGVQLFSGLVTGLLFAWMGSWFGLDRLIIQGIAEFTALDISSAGYYTLFAFVGLIGGLLGRN
ncbi:MAG TPA: hypothetical protein GXX47_05480 [Firmicutes bacterium]|nr:hypothetical protein [Bacillota bacterium]